MKKIDKIILIGVVFFGSGSRVLASTVTWSDITNKFEELNGDDTVVTYDDVSMNITIINDEETANALDDNYFIDFKYEDNIVSLVPRDTSSFNADVMAIYGTADNLIIYYLLETISSLNNIDYELLDTDNFEKYGISLDSEEVSYENNDDNSSISINVEYINAFSVDLDKFEDGISELKSSSNDDKNNTNNDTANDNDVDSDNSENNDNEDNEDNENNDILTNPKTGTWYVYLSFGCLFISIICFGLAFKYRSKKC